jgi:hypothetical protein
MRRSEIQFWIRTEQVVKWRKRAANSFSPATTRTTDLKPGRYVNYEWSFHFHPCFWEKYLPFLLNYVYFLLVITFQSQCCQKYRDWVTCTEDGVFTCRTKSFTVGKETTLCNSEHNNFEVHSKTTIRSSVGTVLQLSLPWHYWQFLNAEGWGGIPQATKTKAALLTPTAGFRFVGLIVDRFCVHFETITLCKTVGSSLSVYRCVTCSTV